MHLKLTAYQVQLFQLPTACIFNCLLGAIPPVYHILFQLPIRCNPTCLLYTIPPAYYMLFYLPTNIPFQLLAKLLTIMIYF